MDKDQEKRGLTFLGWKPRPTGIDQSVKQERIALGGEAFLLLSYDQRDNLNGAWLALKRKRGEPELVRLEKVSSACWDQFGPGQRLTMTLENGKVVSTSAAEREGLGCVEVQSFLRMLRSFGRRPSDYGASARDVDEGLQLASVNFIATLLPVGQAMGRTKRLLTFEEKKKAVGLLNDGLGLVLALACLSDQSDKSIFNVWLSEAVRREIEHRAAQYNMTPSAYAAWQLELAVSR